MHCFCVLSECHIKWISPVVSLWSCAGAKAHSDRVRSRLSVPLQSCLHTEHDKCWQVACDMFTVVASTAFTPLWVLRMFSIPLNLHRASSINKKGNSDSTIRSVIEIYKRQLGVCLQVSKIKVIYHQALMLVCNNVRVRGWTKGYQDTLQSTAEESFTKVPDAQLLR